VIEIREVRTQAEKRRFLTFPWKIYRNDPLWVPPLLRDRERATDPHRGMFFRGGYADFFTAYQHGKLAGTLCCSHENAADPRECDLGFFESINDLEVAQALFEQAENWATGHGLSVLCGTYNLDREDGRGILVEGRDRPPVVLCGHNPPYYVELFEKSGFGRRHDDNLAYAFQLRDGNPALRRLFGLAEKVRRRRSFRVRGAKMEEVEAEIDRILILQNRALAHLGASYDRAAIEQMVLPLKDLADPDLVLFIEADGEAVGWFPAVPNFNEVLIHLNGLRHPWDYVRALRFRRRQPRCLAIKSVAVLPEYWDSGAAVLLFAEMLQRAIAKGYQWLDLSLTGEDNPDTWDLAHRMGAHIYKRYRFFKKEIQAAQKNRPAQTKDVQSETGGAEPPVSSKVAGAGLEPATFGL
jgi:GNAT superfamily N-acetyltransferase